MGPVPSDAVRRLLRFGIVAGAVGIVAASTVFVLSDSTGVVIDPDAVSLPEPGTIEPYFSPDAQWNQPVANFGRSERYDEYADRFWEHSTTPFSEPDNERGNVFLNLGAFSIPIYDYREANQTRRVFTANFGFPGNVDGGAELGWNDQWNPAPGSDGAMILIDPDTGREWELWNVAGRNTTPCITPENTAKGFNPFADLCVGSANLLMDVDGTPADYRTFDGANPNRGSGLQMLALLTRADEVASGSIEHAIEMSVSNTMFGPECAADEQDTDVAGVSCGFYVPPATQVEWEDEAPACGVNTRPFTDEGRSATIPHGMRFALDLTDADIEAWLDERGFDEPRRSTARVFAVAMRDYGFIIADTTCSVANIQTEGTANPVTRAKWARLGLGDDLESRTILNGLITRERLYVVEPGDPVPVVRRDG